MESLEVVFTESWDATFEGQNILGQLKSHYRELAVLRERLSFVSVVSKVNRAFGPLGCR